MTDAITVGSDWTTGYYIAKLVLPALNQANWIKFIVRAPAGTNSAILVQASVNTWQAYSNWGGQGQGATGKSLYAFNSSSSAVPNSTSPGNEAIKVSFNRPFGTDQNTSPFMWEYNLVRYLERNGYDVSYQTDVDTDLDESSLLGHKLDIENGHDEYWSSNMRDAWEAARAAGVNLAFMGGDVGNWQVRYEPGADGTPDRTLVEYRSGANDPDGGNPALATDRFTSSYINRPECELIGGSWTTGGGTGSGDAPRSYYVPSAALSAPATAAWFNGTGFAAGDTFTDTVGYEWDDVVTQPTPCDVGGPDTTAAPLSDVLSFDGLQGATSPGPAHAVTYTEPSSGSRVFSANTMQLNWALDDFAHSAHVNTGAQILFANMFNDLGAIPGPVLNQPASGTTTGSPVTFTWTSTSMALSGYQVNVDGNSVGTLNASACSNGTCSLSVPLSGGTHTWNVTETDLEGATASSQSQSFTVPASPPSQNGGSSSQNGGSSSKPGSSAFGLRSPALASVLWNPTPRLAWSRLQNASGSTRYRVYIDGRTIATTTATSYTPPHALADGRHTWKVVALNNKGQSLASVTGNFVVRSARTGSQSRRQVLAHGLVLSVFCAHRCSINLRVRLGSATLTTQPKGHAGIDAFSVHLSQSLRQRLAAARTATLYVTITTRTGRAVANDHAHPPLDTLRNAQQLTHSSSS